jgi:hypothetical protein
MALGILIKATLQIPEPPSKPMKGQQECIQICLRIPLESWKLSIWPTVSPTITFYLELDWQWCFTGPQLHSYISTYKKKQACGYMIVHQLGLSSTMGAWFC